MSHAILERIEEIFEKPDLISLENVEHIAKEMIGFFDLIRLKLSSEKTEEKEEAIALATALKETLEDKARQMCEKAGIDRSLLEHYINNPFNFSEEEWSSMNATKEGFENYRNEIKEGVPPKNEEPTSSKRIKFPKKTGFKKI